MGDIGGADEPIHGMACGMFELVYMCVHTGQGLDMLD